MAKPGTYPMANWASQHHFSNRAFVVDDRLGMDGSPIVVDGNSVVAALANVDAEEDQRTLLVWHSYLPLRPRDRTRGAPIASTLLMPVALGGNAPTIIDDLGMSAMPNALGPMASAYKPAGATHKTVTGYVVMLPAVGHGRGERLRRQQPPGVVPAVDIVR